jgi:hypothetical protein
MTGTNCDLFTHNQSQSYLNHLVRITTMRCFRVTIVAVEKLLVLIVKNTYNTCIIDLLIRHANRIRLITLTSLAFPVYHIFPHYLINARVLGNSF